MRMLLTFSIFIVFVLHYCICIRPLAIELGGIIVILLLLLAIRICMGTSIGVRRVNCVSNWVGFA